MTMRGTKIDYTSSGFINFIYCFSITKRHAGNH
jgi:hypothetical protein